MDASVFPLSSSIRTVPGLYVVWASSPPRTRRGTKAAASVTARTSAAPTRSARGRRRNRRLEGPSSARAGGVGASATIGGGADAGAEGGAPDRAAGRAGGPLVDVTTVAGAADAGGRSRGGSCR